MDWQHRPHSVGAFSVACAISSTVGPFLIPPPPLRKVQVSLEAEHTQVGAISCSLLRLPPLNNLGWQFYNSGQGTLRKQQRQTDLWTTGKFEVAAQVGNTFEWTPVPHTAGFQICAPEKLGPIPDWFSGMTER